MGAQYSPVLSDDWRGVLAASGAAKLYEQSDWNDISVQGDLGIARLFDRGSASGGLRVGRRWLGGERYSDGIGSWARGRLRLSGALRLDGASDAERRHHPEHPGMNGWTVALRPGLDYALSSQTTLRVGIELEHVEVREDRHGSRLGSPSGSSMPSKAVSPSRPGFPFIGGATRTKIHSSERRVPTGRRACR